MKECCVYGGCSNVFFFMMEKCELCGRVADGGGVFTGKVLGDDWSLFSHTYTH